MPKIPTFTARATPTTEVASIKTNLKLSPTATPAAGLLPAAKAIDEYYIKQRDNNEKLEAKKKFYEMKIESDKIIKQEENNPDEFTAVNTYNQQFSIYTFSKITFRKINRSKIERLAVEIKKIVEGNGASFAFPSTSIYAEKK